MCILFRPSMGYTTIWVTVVTNCKLQSVFQLNAGGPVHKICENFKSLVGPGRCVRSVVGLKPCRKYDKSEKRLVLS